MKDNLPIRKKLRLKCYDYSNPGSYFITICIQNRIEILGKIHDNQIKLSKEGIIVQTNIENIEKVFKDIKIDEYIIMPNHIHLIVEKENILNSVLSNDIRSFKTLVTKEVGFQIWQSSFYDHIIRDDYDYNVHLQYINDNPIKWCEDKYYCG